MYVYSPFLKKWKEKGINKPNPIKCRFICQKYHKDVGFKEESQHLICLLCGKHMFIFAHSPNFVTNYMSEEPIFSLLKVSSERRTNTYSACQEQSCHRGCVESCDEDCAAMCSQMQCLSSCRMLQQKFHKLGGL